MFLSTEHSEGQEIYGEDLCFHLFENGKCKMRFFF